MENKIHVPNHQPEYPYWEISEHFFTQKHRVFCHFPTTAHPDCQGLHSPSHSELVSTKKLLTILSQTLPSELLITWPEKRRVARSCEQLNITGY
jgi:hypothetical protein